MSVAVIADCHIGGEGGAVEPLVAQLDGLAAEGCSRLILLGDVFQVWVALRKFETPEIAAFLGAVARLRERGVPVIYIEGNRDFYLRGAYARHFDAILTRYSFEAGDRSYFAVHGDGLDPADRQYRFWRFLSKNPVSQLLAHLLPAFLARRVIHGTERRLAGTNFRHKIHVPERALRDYAAGPLRAGHDVVLFGHYHDPVEWSLPGGEARVLEAWFHTHRVHWLG
jgi:UDP-2,3-diacylglucosamine hydrolase